MQCNKNLQAVAFDGVPLSPIGRAIAILQDLGSEKFFLFKNCSENEIHLEWDKEEFAELVKQGRITALEKPLRASADAIIVYVRDDARIALKELPRSTTTECIQWHLLRTTTRGWITCVSKSLSTELLDRIGNVLLDESRNALMHFFHCKDQSSALKALELTDMALSAARNDDLRANCYTYYGLALRYTKSPEALNNIFYLIKREVKKWTWSNYLEVMERVEDELRARAKRFFKHVSIGNHSLEGFFAQTDRVSEMPTFEEQIALAIDFASAIIIAPEIKAKLLQKLKQQVYKAGYATNWIDIPPDIFELLRTDPASYMPKVFFNRKLRINLFALCDTLEKIEYSQSTPPSEIMYSLIEPTLQVV